LQRKAIFFRHLQMEGAVSKLGATLHSFHD
jgi:hypothetical protein